MLLPLQYNFTVFSTNTLTMVMKYKFRGINKNSSMCPLKKNQNFSNFTKYFTYD